MSIRNWKEEDLDEITTLMNELAESLKDDDYLISEETVRKLFKDMNNSIYESYVYETDNRIVGFISLVFYKSIFHREGTALINELIVKEEYHNKGIGKDLLHYAIKRSLERGMDEIEVGVMQENLKAIEFYKRNGLTDEYLLLGKDF